MRLTILDAQDTRVLFHAAVFEKGRDLSFVELSSFAHDGVGWRYLAGECRGTREAAVSAAGASGLTIETFSSKAEASDA